MKQMDIYSLLDELPERGDIIETKEGKIRVVGLHEMWGGGGEKEIHESSSLAHN